MDFLIGQDFFHTFKGGKARFARLDGIIILGLVGVGCFVELFWPFNGNHPPYGNGFLFLEMEFSINLHFGV